MFIFRLSNTGEVEKVVNNAGTVKYDIGEILIDTIRILSTVKADNIVEIEAIPESNDVVGLHDLYLQLDIGKSHFEMIIDEHNIEDGLFYAKEDYWKKANAEGRSQ